MSVLGIVCEYNPFHRGHEYHLMMSRRALGGDVPVICVMSGDFVQRGEPAAFSKFARAEAACLCGADLVVELPLPWSLSSAEGFARGAVGLLGALGATHISFGSEAGETEPLQELAEALLDPSLTDEIRTLLDGDGSLSFASARQRALCSRVGELSEQIRLPNNLLGVEYIKAIRMQGLSIEPLTVQRFGSPHDASAAYGPRSGSELRAWLCEGRRVDAFIPEAAMNVYRREIAAGRGPMSPADYDSVLLSRLRMLPDETFETLPDASDGTGKRLCAAARSEAAVEDVHAAAKSKRYALARIRRMTLCAALGIREGMNAGVPPYARVLAASPVGLELLHKAKKNASLPIVTKPASVRRLAPECAALFALGASAHDLYTLPFREKEDKKGDIDWRTGPFIVNNH